MSEPPSNRLRFDQWVWDALAQLYDATALRKSPLTSLLCDARSGPADGTLLRRLLLDTIHGLRPPAGVPAASRDWRLYRLLELRFIEGMEPDEAMSELALGRSQFYRDQADARQRVAEALWSTLQRRVQGATSSVGHDNDNGRESLLRAEAERATSPTHMDGVDAGALLSELRTAATQLAAVQGATCTLEAPPGLLLPADRVLLRQTIISVLCAVLSVPHARSLAVQATLPSEPFDEPGLRIEADWGEPAPPGSALAEAETLLCDARTMMALMGGVLASQPSTAHWTIRLAWPPANRRVVLTIDDNQGLVDLYRRYLAGTVWQVVEAHSIADARAALRERRPDVILLDLLMPQEDGLDLLVALKQNAETADIPVVVCSVLSQPGFALEMGATAYLAKPVTQEGLLRLLHQWEAR